MNKGFRLGSKTKYNIEVNDRGETVSIDLADPSLLSKVQTMHSKIKQAEHKHANLNHLLDEELTEEYLLSDKGVELGLGLKQFYIESRDAVDEFLGVNACHKIFGDENWLNMFDDLFTQLAPYLDLAGEKFTEYTKSIAKDQAKKVPQDHKRSL